MCFVFYVGGNYINCKICGFLLEESEVKDAPLLNKTSMSSVNDTYNKISNFTEDSLKENRKPINSLKDNINNKSSFSVSLNYNGGMTSNVYSKSNNKLLVVAFVIIYLLVILLYLI